MRSRNTSSLIRSRINRLMEQKAVAVLRMQDPTRVVEVAWAIHRGGISIIEITMTIPGAISLIHEVAARAGEEMLIGAGTVLDPETAEKAISSGAAFVVSPILRPDLIPACHRRDVPVAMGAFSPTEIACADEAGADFVKIFPADQLGMSYLKALKGPFPDLKLMPTGGVNLTNAGEWIRAGAAVVGVGGALLDSRAIAERRYEVLTENAIRLRRSIDSAQTA